MSSDVITNYVACVLLALLLVLYIISLLYHRYQLKVHVYCFSSQWRVLQRLVSLPDFDDEDKLYDAFVIYCQEDEEFVMKTLVPYLEETQDRKYKLCLLFRDCLPGELTQNQVGRLIRSSRRAIVVVSPQLMQSLDNVDILVALNEIVMEVIERERVIVVLYEGVPVGKVRVHGDLKSFLGVKTNVRWGSSGFWKQLVYALPHVLDNKHGVLHLVSSDTK